MQEGDTSNYLTFEEDDNAAEESITLVLLVFLVKKKRMRLPMAKGPRDAIHIPLVGWGDGLGFSVSGIMETVCC